MPPPEKADSPARLLPQQHPLSAGLEQASSLHYSLILASRAASFNEVGAPEEAEDKKDFSLDDIASTSSVEV
ncbi:hypothetical protein E2C01_065215 [Portunus trituberculatus]|uniref:Uncharacterized protein n=1 Tax=Portunus trituberculatus TaxID=210409 RepID=A0A5B7HME4_PORTR|nr:hypothetical protein [Portunus trituberculatus]